MTSRFFRHDIGWESYAQATGLVPPPGIDPPEPKANIAPGSWLPVIRRAPYGPRAPEMALMLWGLVPSWWSQPLSEKRWSSFNARAEEIDEAPSFRGAFRYRRCLVPASGFLVWSGAEGRRLPFAIGLIDRPWFCFAGIWECWGHDGSEIDTLAILTVPANDLVAAHSSRMPLILPPRQHDRWLDSGPEAATRLCQPYRADEMEEWPVDPAIGDTRNQEASLLSR